MTSDTTQPAGALPEPKLLAVHPEIVWGYTADDMRAMMAERDAARAQSERWQKSVDALRDERDALRRELEELRAIPPDAREGREPLTEGRILGITVDIGRLKLGQSEGHVAFARAIEAAHRIGPAGTSADGETQP